MARSIGIRSGFLRLLILSDRREPCILIEDDAGKPSMFLDWTDFKLAQGGVAEFERAVGAKLLNQLATLRRVFAQKNRFGFAKPLVCLYQVSGLA